MRTFLHAMPKIILSRVNWPYCKATNDLARVKVSKSDRLDSVTRATQKKSKKFICLFFFFSFINYYYYHNFVWIQSSKLFSAIFSAAASSGLPFLLHPSPLPHSSTICLVSISISSKKLLILVLSLPV
ncbi:unnamed protein product [Citrullus colocynthis]|uniref:Uncharacterized protein n=1 Tax=Citrullus colocynthis TaxID=252529 RepID=A0ABP0XQW7_9ROSI